MALFGAFLKKTAKRAAPEAHPHVKDWARAAAQAGSETVFAINEIACNDPSCPGIETVILVMEPGKKTRAVKIQKPLDAISEQDVVEAFKS